MSIEINNADDGFAIVLRGITESGQVWKLTLECRGLYWVRTIVSKLRDVVRKKAVEVEEAQAALRGQP